MRPSLAELYGSKMDTKRTGRRQAMTIGTTKTATMRAERAINELTTERLPGIQRSFETGQDCPGTGTDMRGNRNESQAQTTTTTGGVTRRGGAGGGGGVPVADTVSARQPQAQARSQNTRVEGNMRNYVAVNSDNHSYSQILGQRNGQPMLLNRLPQRVVQANTTVMGNTEEVPSASSIGRRNRVQQQTMQHPLHQQQSHGVQSQQHQHVPQYQHRHERPLNVGHTNETATDGLIEMIRRTVQSAVEASMRDVINHQFDELFAKMDQFHKLIKETNENIAQMKKEILSKIVHYGEENSRHFRYLCMKSEYDKMFYQHQTMMKTNAASYKNINGQAKQYKAKYAPNKLGKNVNPKYKHKGVPLQSPCKCRSATNAKHPKPEPQPRLGDNTSSDMNLHEVLSQLQHHCDPNSDQSQMTTTEILANLENILSTAANNNSAASDPSAASLQSNGYTKARQELESSGDTADEEEVDTETETYQFKYSSDDTTSRSDDSDVGYPTARLPSQYLRRSNRGAGDC